MIPRPDITGTRLVEAYHSNETPVHALSIESQNAKPIKFGTHLKDDEKAWLLARLRHSLLPPDAAFENPYFSSSSARKRDLQPVKSKALRLEGNPIDFTLTVPSRSALWLFLAGTIAIFAAVFLFHNGLQNLPDLGKDTSLFSKIFASLFTVTPLLMGTFFALASLVLFSLGFRNFDRVKTLRFTPGRVSVQTTKRGAPLKTETRPQADFTRLKVKQSGHVNNDPRYRVTLRGTARPLSIHSFLPDETVQRLTPWLHHWLQS